jgi:phosphoglycerol transferase MdoB-like AlkP superfamily enzyme
MKERIVYLIKIFLVFAVFFALTKPFFLWLNEPEGTHYTLGQIVQTVGHGVPMDAAMCGYILILPFVVMWLSLWVRKFPYRAVLGTWLTLCSVVVVIIAVADIALFAFWQFKIDATVFFYLDTPGEALASVSAGYVIVRVLVILVLAAAMSWLCIRFTPKKFAAVQSEGKKGKVRFGLLQVLMVLIGGAMFLTIRGGVGRSTMNVGNAYWCNDLLLNQTAVNPTFSLLSSISKQENFADKYNLLPEAEREKLYSQLYPVDQTDSMEMNDATTLLNTTRPNVLIIEMESFGGKFIEALGGVPGVAPNYNRLIHEGVFFSNLYANSFRTDRGTVSLVSGHISYPSTSIMKLPTKLTHLPALSRTLVKAGYSTDFLYGGDINFTNTKGYLLAMGYQHITSDVDFTEAQRHSNAWGVNDDITFDYLYRQIVKRDGRKPWHTAFLTLSSHEPFIVPYHRFSDIRLNAFAYTDHCLGQLIERLKKTPQWKNMLIVCLPDHGFRYNVTTDDPFFYHVPMLWLGGAVRQPRVVSTLMNQSDLAATLLAQLKLPHSDFKYSRNVLSKGYRYPFVYCTSGGNFMFADSTGVTLYDLSAKRTLHDTPKPSAERLKKGMAILQTTYDELGKW